MKKLVVLAIALGFIQQLSFTQVTPSEGGMFSQSYSKETAEYKAVDFILNDVLELDDGELSGAYINSISAAVSGELSAVIFDCPDHNKKGIILCFWEKYINKYNTHYRGYAFKYMEYSEAKKLLSILEKVIEDKKEILNSPDNDFSMYAFFKWKDLSFVFFKVGIANKIRVFWNSFDSEWTQSNLKTTIRRFNKYFEED